MRKRVAWMIGLLAAVLLCGCQTSSQTSQPKSALFTVGTNKEGKLERRDKFTLGETPQVFLSGYPNRDVVLELWRNGRPVMSKPFRVPAAKTYTQSEGVVFQENFESMRPVRRTRMVTISQTGMSLKGLPVGYYELRLKVNDVAVENAKFSLLGE